MRIQVQSFYLNIDGFQLSPACTVAVVLLKFPTRDVLCRLLQYVTLFVFRTVLR